MFAPRFVFASRSNARASFRILVATALIAGIVNHTGAIGTITYVGVIRDRTDFESLSIGKAGYWFPQFDAMSPVAGRPTGENARDALPTWAGPLNHVTRFLDSSYWSRTFSQDGPCRSKGGQPKWNDFTLPAGKTGRSGAIVDPFAFKNSNNSINRIQLGMGTPATFFFHIVTDNTNMEHNPANRLRARGHSNGVDLEANASPKGDELQFNGIADIYTFRYDGFGAGDFIKVQLAGNAAHKQGPSIGGFLFDKAFEPNLAAPPKLHRANNGDDAACAGARRRGAGEATRHCGFCIRKRACTVGMCCLSRNWSFPSRSLALRPTKADFMNLSDNGSSRRERRHFTSAQKAAIGKRRLVDRVPLSELCDAVIGHSRQRLV